MPIFVLVNNSLSNHRAHFIILLRKTMRHFYTASKLCYKRKATGKIQLSFAPFSSQVLPFSSAHSFFEKRTRACQRASEWVFSFVIIDDTLSARDFAQVTTLFAPQKFHRLVFAPRMQRATKGMCTHCTPRLTLVNNSRDFFFLFFFPFLFVHPSPPSARWISHTETNVSKEETGQSDWNLS